MLIVTMTCDSIADRLPAAFDAAHVMRALSVNNRRGAIECT